jgi:branched-chain amino acid aminotransferase
MSDERESKFLWLDGELLPWPEANVHVTTIGVASSTAIFEGIRGYWNQAQEQLYLFRVEEHMRRFAQSMKFVWMSPTFSSHDLTEAIRELVRANNAREDFYVRPMAYYSGGGFFARPPDKKVRILLDTTPFASHLGTNKSISCCISSWTRISDNVMPPRVKCGANYPNNMRASREAQMHGYDDAIMLNSQGKVTEASVACVFMIRNGIPTTSPITSGILESITRATLIELFQQEMDLKVVERDIDRTELYISDEMFYCGTGAEITAITSVDGFQVGDGSVGPITQEIMTKYQSVVRGDQAGYMKWCTPVW